MHILQVSSTDHGGGAEQLALALFREYRRRHLLSWLAVGHRRLDDDDILQITNSSGNVGWEEFWININRQIESSAAAARLVRAINRLMANPLRFASRVLGVEDYDYPGTRRLQRLTPLPPSIIHAHNLHGGYFDLRILPILSNKLPVVLTLHDAWLLSGHCADSLGCDRWRTGCGRCPDLSIYPAVGRDATAWNWERKRGVFLGSRLYIITPCQWLLDRVEKSILAPAIAGSAVIPNGVNLDVFHPGNRLAAREQLSIPADAAVLLFIAQGGHLNRFKDYFTIRTAVNKIVDNFGDRKIILLAVGASEGTEKIGTSEIRYLPYQPDPKTIASYYRAADLYLHAANADTFPTVILEALACGTPVIATGICGIPEQVEDGVTGFLVGAQDSAELAAKATMLLRDKLRLALMSERAVAAARFRFDFNRQATDYLNFYEWAIADFQSRGPRHSNGS